MENKLNTNEILVYLKNDKIIGDAIKEIVRGTAIKINNKNTPLLVEFIEELIVIFNDYAIISLQDLKRWVSEYITDIIAFARFKKGEYIEIHHSEILYLLATLILLNNDDYRPEHFEQENEFPPFEMYKKILKKLRG